MSSATTAKGPEGAAGNQQQEKRKKESIVDLAKYLEKSVRVKFAGGREASGILKVSQTYEDHWYEF